MVARLVKERQSEKGMEEFVVTELAADLGGFHSFLSMTHDQFMELLTYVEPTIIGCDTIMRECITPHEMLVVTLRYLSSGLCLHVHLHIPYVGFNTLTSD